MKKFLAFLLLVPGLCFAQGKRSPSTIGFSKIAYVNIDTLEARCTLLKEKRKEAISRREQKENDLDESYHQLQQEAEALENKSKSKRTNDAEYEAAQKRIIQKQQKLDMRRQEIMDQAGKDQEEVNADFKEILNSYLDDYNKIWHFDCILSYSSSDLAVLYINRQLDITSDILEGMNSLNPGAGTRKPAVRKKK
jgi:outer membrane protein